MAENNPTTPDEHRPAVESPDTVRGGTAETAGRDGDTIAQDHITQGQPLDGEEGDDVDRRAP